MRSWLGERVSLPLRLLELPGKLVSMLLQRRTDCSCNAGLIAAPLLDNETYNLLIM